MQFTPGIIHQDFTEASKPDDKGYWTLNAGAFNCHNRSGDFYPLTKKVEEMFASSSSFMRRVNEKQLYGEWFHPTPTKGMKLNEWLARVCSYDKDNICLFISKLGLVDGNDDKGNAIKIVRARLRPFGKQGSIFEDSLRDPEINSALSVRSITDDRFQPNGTRIKEVTSIWCYDAVTSQGIEIADKMRTGNASLESMDFTKEDLGHALTTPRSEHVGFEADEPMATQVLSDLGWETVQTLPSNMNWLANN